MTNASTPSAVATVSERQARKLVDQLTPGMVEAIVDSSLPRDRFQKIVEQERQLCVRSRFVQFLRDIAAEIIDMVAIHSDYTALNAIAKALDDNRFDTKYLELRPEQIPLMGSGEVDHEVGEVHLNQYLTTREVMAKIDERGYKFADPLTALLYALKLPDRQRQHPLVILFEDSTGRICYLILGGDGLERNVHGNRDSLDDRRPWRWYYRFLVVRK